MTKIIINNINKLKLYQRPQFGLMLYRLNRKLKNSHLPHDSTVCNAKNINEAMSRVFYVQ